MNLFLIINKIEKGFLTKTTFILFLFLSQIRSHALFSQSSFGIHIGKSYSKFKVTEGMAKVYDFSPDFDHQGFLVNISYSHQINKYLDAVSDIGYAKRGTIVTRDYTIVGFDKFSLNYIDLSTGLGVSPNKFLTINGGFSSNYLISAIHSWDKDRSSNSTEFYKRIDIGLKTGLVITFKNISINANYFYGLKPVRVFSLSALTDPIKKKYHNRSLEFSIGNMFDLKKKEKAEGKGKK